MLIIFVDHVKKWMSQRKQKRKQNEIREESRATELEVEGMEGSKKGKRANDFLIYIVPEE